MFTMKKLLVAATVLLSAMQAQATIAEFTFLSTVRTSAIAGVSVGDTVSITLLADNGGSGLVSQSWTIADLISGSLTAGSYWQSYTDGWFSGPLWEAFRTDASGSLELSDFFGTTYSVNHEDSFGTGPQIYLFNGAFQDLAGSQAGQADFLDELGRWTVSEREVSPIPEPGSLALAGLGFAGAALLRRRRVQA